MLKVYDERTYGPTYTVSYRISSIRIYAMHYMSRKFWPILNRKLLRQIGLYFFDIKYT